MNKKTKKLKEGLQLLEAMFLLAIAYIILAHGFKIVVAFWKFLSKFIGNM
jgi:hypothetical protein